jgi:hypothetical protein
MKRQKTISCEIFGVFLVFFTKNIGYDKII